MIERSLAAIALAATVLVAAAPPVAAQAPKLAGRPYVDSQNGYRFKVPARWDAVPVQPNRADAGLLCQMGGGSGSLFVVRIDEVDDEREDAADAVSVFLADRLELTESALVDDEDVGKDDLPARRRVYETGGFVIDLWAYSLDDCDIAIGFVIDAEDKHVKRWRSVFNRAGKSFTRVETEETTALSKNSSYADQLAYHEEEASRTPGWRALPTPSEKFIVKTSTDNDKFIKEVIERLELSRELYEADFPPEKGFDHVSVVRICGTEPEFHKYGGTGGGVAGWFNPGTTELVLYDAKNTDRNMTFAVMSHEAFHQYCHFLFDQSEAHRWFDEGHGDYYGGAKFKRGRAQITPKMPGGLERLSVIRQMVRDETYAPIPEHINYSHQEWQTQGPSNVSCYAQSWSIVYMLRMGVLKKVPRKLWREEYADIIPNYVTTLFEGYTEAYEELREKKMKELERRGKGRSGVIDDERLHVSPERKKKIWEAAMSASWGKVDLEQFEQDWKAYVAKELK